MDNIVKKNFFLNKFNLLNFDRKKMNDFFSSINEKSFRVDQIMIWMYQKFCHDFDKMTNFSYKLRNKLKKISVIQIPKFVNEVISEDHTIKWIINSENGIFETVYIPEKKRGTLCLSSQIGCILNCQFCSTGMQGFHRNLLVSEIIGQILMAYKCINYKNQLMYHPITNIVMMGMGEPLLNFKNLICSLNIIFDKNGLNFSKKKVVVSTSGIVPALDKLSKIMDVKLAISLHASNDILRNKLMPVNYKYSIKSLLSSIKRFLKISKLNKNGITIEYVMLKNINDTLLHAKELSILLKNIPSKINLIPWNYFPNSNFSCSLFSQINDFFCFMVKKGFTVTIRKKRGHDIQAACGQLSTISIDSIQSV
ncbi:23S rRNA (adenine(2503)-C(2))-methyltransferase RlmN [Buchnera aphidicola]|uniref:23S rRNA (adenine(2503)-C(2))-methyltransferase RlmN n=1 Tax=Buchnera aphidicola TaxID=9 RepID=UPI003464A709